jgi:signal transduction histidine kinase
VIRVRTPNGTIARGMHWLRSNPFAADVMLAAVLGVLSVVGFAVADADGSERSPDVAGAGLVVATAAAFAWRRRAPLASMLTVVAFTIAFWVSDYPSAFDPFSILAVYAATAHGGPDRRRVWWVVAGVVVILTGIATMGVLSPSEDLPAAAIVGIAVVHLTAAITGEVVHDRRRRLADLEERAIRAETERELLTRQAVLDERTRIARDLHDVVAHGMSVMVVQSGAAERLVDARPGEAKEAMRHVQTTGREALNEMRRMLGVLRDHVGDDPDLSPQPTMDDLDDLLRNCDDAGVPTELRIEGQRPARVVGAEMAGYRIVQEALTNVVKHAGRPARAAVKVTYGPDRMRVEITDDGLGATTDTVDGATGHGLIGMRERVELYDGSLQAGPRPGGGFRVSAVIPLEHAAGR